MYFFIGKMSGKTRIYNGPVGICYFYASHSLNYLLVEK
jgi:hypothetical protein